MTTISNNLTELLAAVLGLEYVGQPCHWHTDSIVTQYRLTTSRKFKNIPAGLVARAEAVKKLVARTTLLKGHPNRKELANGIRKGLPVSAHNVFCDGLCTERAKELLESAHANHQ